MLFRIDMVQLSNEAMPTGAIENGTTLYFVDTRQFFIYYKGEWYEQTSEGDA